MFVAIIGLHPAWQIDRQTDNEDHVLFKEVRQRRWTGNIGPTVTDHSRTDTGRLSRTRTDVSHVTSDHWPVRYTTLSRMLHALTDVTCWAVLASGQCINTLRGWTMTLVYTTAAAVGAAAADGAWPQLSRRGRTVCAFSRYIRIRCEFVFVSGQLVSRTEDNEQRHQWH